MDYNVCFIIGTKQYPHIRSYLDYYIQNISSFYPESSILIVDNQSFNFDECKEKLEKYKNTTVVSNTDESKFDIGAYTFGLKYLIENQLISQYSYFILTHDNFVIKNKYDFHELREKKVNACSLLHYAYKPDDELGKEVLQQLGLYNELEKIHMCLFGSFIVSQEKVLELYEKYLKHIVASTKRDSESAERFMGRILYELNDHSNYAIDGFVNVYDGDFLWIAADRIEVSTYFKKSLSNRPD